jgi:RNA polymerase sigma-70 factor (ECF subfamily)
LNLDIETIPDRSDNDPGIDQERLQAAIDDLAPGYRVVLLMFYYEDCSYREIAERLNLPIGTVMSRLARAKGHLRSQLFELERHGVPDAQVSAASQCG